MFMADGRDDDFTTHSGGVADGRGDDALPVIDAGIEPTPPASRKPWAALAGAGAVAAVLAVGAIAITGGGSEIDTAETEANASAVQESDEETSSDDATEGDTADGDGEATTAMADDDPFAVEEAMATEFFGGGLSAAIFDGERFVSLSMNNAGWALRTSIDGVDWEESPVTGIPADGYASWLEFHDGTYVAFGDSYDEGNGSTSWVVTSTDGTTWSVADLPAAGDNTSIVGATVSNDGVLILRTEFNDSFGDGADLLLELGLIEDYDSFCGFDQFEPGGEIMIYVCNFEEFDDVAIDDGDFGPTDEEIQALSEAYDAATSDEERAAVEKQLEELWNESVPQEDFVSVQPGEPGFDQLQELIAAQNDRSMPMTTITGPFGGPFTEADEFIADGYSNGLVSIDAGIFTAIDTFDEETFRSMTTVYSWTGSDWVDVGELPEGLNGQLHGLDDMLLFSGSDDFGQSRALTSTNGITWVDSGLESDINGGYTQFISGEAGVVAITMGYEDGGFPGGPTNEVATIDKDGFVLELSLFSGEATLSDSAGLVIYELDSAWEPGPDSDIARINPISGDITFLDPETGDDLLLVTSAEIEEAFGFDDQDFSDEDFVEPDQLTEVHFSVDGTSWELLEIAQLATVSPNTQVIPVAVGDDEAIFSLHSYEEPPAELLEFEVEGREPTEEEIDALESFDGGAGANTYIRVPLG